MYVFLKNKIVGRDAVRGITSIVKDTKRQGFLIIDCTSEMRLYQSKASNTRHYLPVVQPVRSAARNAGRPYSLGLLLGLLVVNHKLCNLRVTMICCQKFSKTVLFLNLKDSLSQTPQEPFLNGMNVPKARKWLTEKLCAPTHLCMIGWVVVSFVYSIIAVILYNILVCKDESSEAGHSLCPQLDSKDMEEACQLI
ncbi:hypothetical protein MAR_021273 [Mya arenaria]|uniref:Uncharacterized protein n=1 Tax=Mya arenaria TaxID=6604 RepID=A0ABY7E9U7_MYAAR|nr:hypothetical protein MAR_021273 [Mya arenaria]